MSANTNSTPHGHEEQTDTEHDTTTLDTEKNKKIRTWLLLDVLCKRRVAGPTDLADGIGQVRLTKFELCVVW
jgi:hypothetical protein